MSNKGLLDNRTKTIAKNFTNSVKAYEDKKSLARKAICNLEVSIENVLTEIYIRGYEQGVKDKDAENKQVTE
jgi:hypothetical protein